MKELTAESDYQLLTDLKWCVTLHGNSNFDVSFIELSKNCKSKLGHKNCRDKLS